MWGGLNLLVRKIATKCENLFFVLCDWRLTKNKKLNPKYKSE